MRRMLVAVAAFGLLLAACASNENPVVAPSAGGGGSPSSSATAADCAQGVTTYVNSGQLTVGTDNPAYPPWYAGDDTQGTNWKINNPATGKGFESAVAYAVADKMGFSRDQVQWVEVPFNQSFAPGPKSFDFDINQISYSPKRAKAVDFSQSYYDVNPALVALQGTPIAKATSLSDLKNYSLASQIGTTDYDYIANVIQPTKEPGAYNSLADAVQALKSGNVDGIVVDLPTAFYITAVQIPQGVIVGQFPAEGQQEYFAMAFQKGNSLVQCVNQALDELKSEGTLKAIQDRWLSSKVSVPVLST
ncbi:MAG TPA: ABC transporter substrate-binding protein [Actinomycetota bacterium]|nr:ABC transporter substrate-binding protein [Actinomycetota bacterium]